ncbi:MAG TPA: cupin domain-containing protein [Trueperaceae bacterium]|nr:cupin domain-containing protein [Trueperaceae bacterium]
MAGEPAQPQTALFENVLDARRCREEAFTPVPLAEGAHLKALLVCFRPGQRIPVHAPGIDLAILVLEGEGTLASGRDEIPLKPGAMAFVPAGRSRGITAKTRMTAFQVVSPPPTDVDHRDVRAGLRHET